MAIKPQLRRKSDGLILCSVVRWVPAIWVPRYIDPTLYTINNATYRQHIGVQERVAEITGIFSPKYPNSSVESYYRCVAADRAGSILQLRDQAGVWKDCIFQEALEGVDQLGNVVHFPLFEVEMKLVQTQRF